MLAAVFFDLDDTLCDAKAAWSAGVASAFDLLQARFPDINVHQAFATWQEVNRELLAALGAGELRMAEVRDQRFFIFLSRLGQLDPQFADELNHVLATARLRAMRFFADVECTLATLRRTFHVGIITNGAADGHLDSQRSTVQKLGLLDRVDSLWISDEVGHRKPDRRIFDAALTGVGIQSREAIYVGDSLPNDIAGANAAGLHSVLIVRSGAVNVPSRPEKTPDWTVRDLSEVVRIARGQGRWRCET